MIQEQQHCCHPGYHRIVVGFRGISGTWSCPLASLSDVPSLWGPLASVTDAFLPAAHTLFNRLLTCVSELDEQTPHALPSARLLRFAAWALEFMCFFLSRQRCYFYWWTLAVAGQTELRTPPSDHESCTNLTRLLCAAWFIHHTKAEMSKKVCSQSVEMLLKEMRWWKQKWFVLFVFLGTISARSQMCSHWSWLTQSWLQINQKFIIKHQNCLLNLLAVKCGQNSPTVDMASVKYAQNWTVFPCMLMHQALKASLKKQKQK